MGSAASWNPFATGSRAPSSSGAAPISAAQKKERWWWWNMDVEGMLMDVNVEGWHDVFSFFCCLWVCVFSWCFMGLGATWCNISAGLGGLCSSVAAMGEAILVGRGDGGWKLEMTICANYRCKKAMYDWIELEVIGWTFRQNLANAWQRGCGCQGPSYSLASTFP